MHIHKSFLVVVFLDVTRFNSRKDWLWWPSEFDLSISLIKAPSFPPLGSLTAWWTIAKVEHELRAENLLGSLCSVWFPLLGLPAFLLPPSSYFILLLSLFFTRELELPLAIKDLAFFEVDLPQILRCIRLSAKELKEGSSDSPSSFGWNQI